MNRHFSATGLLLATSSIAICTDEPPDIVRKLIANHCIDCHGPMVQKAIPTRNNCGGTEIAPKE